MGEIKRIKNNPPGAPSAWSLFAYLAILITAYVVWNETIDWLRDEEVLSVAAFSRDLAAHRMMDGYSQQGAAANQDVLEGYQIRLMQHFPDLSTINGTEIPAEGRTFLLRVDECSLVNEKIGILANPEQRGLLWERPAVLSYYENGELVFQSRAGARVHGGDYARSFISEVINDEGAVPSMAYQYLGWRFYLRSAYESVSLPASSVWDAVTGPLRQLVMLKTKDDFANSIGFDIARRVGLPAPYTVPVRYYLNGNDQGVRLLVERVDLSFIENRYGHRDFEIIRFKDDYTNVNWQEFNKITRELRVGDGVYDLKDVSRYINIDSLLSQYILYLLIEDYDNYQGLMVRDLRSNSARWSFVIWDLEGGLAREWARDTYFEKNPEAPKLYSLHLGMKSVQSEIWRDLQNDNDFHLTFSVAVLDAINHKLTASWLNKLVDRHREEAKRLGVADPERFEEIRKFLLDNRKKLITLLTEDWELGPLYSVEVIAPIGETILVDGNPVGDHYFGQYLFGSEVNIRLKREVFNTVFWNVNGTNQSGQDGQLAVDILGNTEIILTRYQ
jgi:CotH kinase protein